MLLFYAKANVKESWNFEQAQLKNWNKNKKKEKHFGHLAIFWFSTFAMFLRATRSLVSNEALQDK